MKCPACEKSSFSTYCKIVTDQRLELDGQEIIDAKNLEGREWCIDPDEMISCGECDNVTEAWTYAEEADRMWVISLLDLLLTERLKVLTVDDVAEASAIAALLVARGRGAT